MAFVFHISQAPFSYYWFPPLKKNNNQKEINESHRDGGRNECICVKKCVHQEHGVSSREEP